MITTWQKILAIFIGIVFGLIVGYICIKPHLEESNVPATQNLNTDNVFEQYLYTNNTENTKSTVGNDYKN